MRSSTSATASTTSSAVCPFDQLNPARGYWSVVPFSDYIISRKNLSPHDGAYPGGLAASPNEIFQFVASSSCIMVSATRFLCSSFKGFMPRIRPRPLVSAIEVRKIRFRRSSSMCRLLDQNIRTKQEQKARGDRQERIKSYSIPANRSY